MHLHPGMRSEADFPGSREKHHDCYLAGTRLYWHLPFAATAAAPERNKTSRKTETAASSPEGC